MTRFFNLPPLLAQAEHWREMGRDFRTDHSKLDPMLIFVCVVVLFFVVLFLWGLVRLMNRQEGRRLFNNPKQLFTSLCRAHDLTSPQRRLLAQVARVQNLPQPASLFLEPGRLTSAAANPSFKAQQSQLNKLRVVLFADLAAEAHDPSREGLAAG